MCACMHACVCKSMYGLAIRQWLESEMFEVYRVTMSTVIH